MKMTCTVPQAQHGIPLSHWCIVIGYGYFMTSIPPLLHLCILWWIFRMLFSIKSTQFDYLIGLFWKCFKIYLVEIQVEYLSWNNHIQWLCITGTVLFPCCFKTLVALTPFIQAPVFLRVRGWDSVKGTRSQAYTMEMNRLKQIPDISCATWKEKICKRTS